MLSTSLSIFVFMLTISTNNLVDFFFYIFHTSLTPPLFFIEVSVVTQIPLKTGGELRCSRRVSSSFSTSDTRFRFQPTSLTWTYCYDKMTNKKYYTVGKILKSIIKIVERVIVDTFTHNICPLTFLTWYRHFNKK
jgi:hypothetical protein